jgi:hypothetical protein
MLPERPDDEDLTVFCQTCGEWGHPRGECARDSRHETAPLPVMKLRRQGPLSGAEFEGTSYESKQKHGIAKFDLVAHSNGPMSTFGPTSTVYYLSHEHRPLDVIEEWLRANRKLLDGRDLTTENITRALSKNEFQEAWKRLRDDRDFETLDEPDHADRGGDHYDSRNCPYCGQTIKSLPGHLPCGEQESVGQQ